ncbi:MAG: signal peptide peptidase SppA [Candidatus Marinimicrobia bacterium]|jgi:protease-4|nr:signal peptide peptidase SppA [Candidatus Neomarinimicrobiota bacterium]MBT3575635.1 signal peptide peptidase SppA [Candidatus Neomarinimicrobiota bacterium]MBT3679882.1 signal peptide peptidase SppA [Candidatus Neomarinimicrobiota bacterium]MBT3952032.1 signal peptide peptidase SppA [Candidatus Neomarinimicrobiota bacterium]MBT4251923.1 signal peptide peptidase SppA [Candidatus Neomarinimicrobiota bacterium]
MMRILFVLFLSITSLIGQIQLIPQSVAASDDPMSVAINPAGLAFNNHTESMLVGHFDGSIFTKDFGYYSQSKTAGFGYQWDVASARNIYQFSQGFMVSNTHAMGLTYSFDHSNWDEGRLNLGWMHRPFPMVALGASIANAWSANDEFRHITGGVAFQGRTGRWGGGVDLGMTIDDSGAETDYIMDQSLTVFVEPLNGIRVNAWMDLDNTSSTGISLSMFLPDVGVESHARSNNNGAQSVVVRSTQNPYRTLFGGQTIKKNQKTYLRMNLSGLIIEEPEMKRPKIPFDINFNIPFLGGQTVYGRQLRKLIDQIDEYTDDPNLDGLIIDLGNIRGGFSKMSEVRNAFQRFHDAGKEIIVYSKFGLGNGSTYLLSMADEIYVHEMAGVDLRGLGMEITFFRGLLDTLSIVPEVWRVSPYKTAGDVYLNSTMSDAMHENYSQLLDGVYEEFVRGISEGKIWEDEKTRAVIDAGPYMLTDDAKEAGLITDTMYPDEFDDYVNDLNDGKVNIIKPKKENHHPDYQYAWRHDKVNDRIAVIYAVGGIVSGETRPGPSGSKNMGDETIAAAIKQAREDKSIKAIVLRIDSGGGSALASDIMWREIIKTTKEDSSNVKPLIASMSDVAASGGYYIACEADSIIAYPSTITGSIGVIGSRLNFSQLKERFGLHTESILHGKHADFASGNRLATEEESTMILASINDTYLRFKERVVAGREKIHDVDALDSLALGRVWTGSDAKAYGLIDELGGYYEAIELAKEAAGIEGDVDIVELPNYKQKTDFKKLLGGETNIHLGSDVLETLHVDDLITILEGDEIQMILPVKIEIK